MSTATQLATTGQWTRTSLNLPAQMSFDEWLGVGAQLNEMEQSVQWWVGDWLLFGEETFAEKLGKAAELTGYSIDRLKEARRVAAAFPVTSRSDKLGWTHYKAAVQLPAEQRVQVIRQAEAEGWTSRDTRYAVARITAGIEEGLGSQTLALPDAAERMVRRVGKLVQAAFCDWFGVGDEYSRVIMALYQAGGKPMDWRDIARFVSAHQPMTRGALHEAIHVLRETFESEAIDRDDSGYWLSEVGFAECRRAFRELGLQLNGMGAEPANDTSASLNITPANG